jgi:glycosyltransferase involved in cell wall biosynthesis
MKINIVIPAYLPTEDHVRFLKEAIGSVYAQTFDDWICTVVINGGVADSTFNEYDSRVDLISFPYKSSAATARNIGAAQHLDCEYVCFLDADDMFYSNKLEKQLAAFEEDESLDFCFTRASLIDHNSNHVGSYSIHNHSALITKDIQNVIEEENVFILSSVIGKLKSFISSGMFVATNEYRIGSKWPKHANNKGYLYEDFMFHHSALQHGYQFKILDEELVKYRTNSSVER